MASIGVPYAVYLDSDKPQSVAREFEEMTGRPDAWPDALTPLGGDVAGGTVGRVIVEYA
jgi:hypothetical protein